MYLSLSLSLVGDNASFVVVTLAITHLPVVLTPGPPEVSL